MNMEERERIRALEVTIEHLTTDMAEVKETVRELRDMLVGARAVRWALWVLIPIGGFFLGIASKYLPFLPLPR